LWHVGQLHFAFGFCACSVSVVLDVCIKAYGVGSLRKIIFLIFLFALMVAPSHALDISVFDSPYCVSYYNADEFVYGNQSSIVASAKDGAYDAKLVSGISSNVADLTYDGTYFYYVLANGEVYRTYDTGGYQDFSDSITQTENTVLLGDIGNCEITYYPPRIVVDDDSNVFVSLSGSRKIYVFSYPSYSLSLFTELPYAVYAQYISGMSGGSDGIYITRQNGGTTGELGIVDSNGDYTALKTGLPWKRAAGLSVLSNGNVIILSGGSAVSGTTTLSISELNASDSYSVSSIGSFSGLMMVDLSVDESGIIYVPDKNNDLVRTFSTVGYTSGYVMYSDSEPFLNSYIDVFADEFTVNGTIQLNDRLC